MVTAEEVAKMLRKLNARLDILLVDKAHHQADFDRILRELPLEEQQKLHLQSTVIRLREIAVEEWGLREKIYKLHTLLNKAAKK